MLIYDIRESDSFYYICRLKASSDKCYEDI